MAAPDLTAFVRAMDCCWLERRFDDLPDFLASDVVFVAPGGTQRIEGLPAAIDSYRAFMSASDVQRFEPSDFKITERGDAAVAEYDWDMAWTSDGNAFAETGREILVLARRDRQWRVVWRTQISAGKRPDRV